jgi:hypothetical protein
VIKTVEVPLGSPLSLAATVHGLLASNGLSLSIVNVRPHVITYSQPPGKADLNVVLTHPVPPSRDEIIQFLLDGPIDFGSADWIFEQLDRFPVSLTIMNVEGKAVVDESQSF